MGITIQKDLFGGGVVIHDPRPPKPLPKRLHKPLDIAAGQAKLSETLFPTGISAVTAAKYARTHNKPKPFIERLFPAFTPTYIPEWSAAQQRETLDAYLAYLGGACAKAGWMALGAAVSSTQEALIAQKAVTEAERQVITTLNAKGVYTTSPLEAALAAQRGAIVKARKAMRKALQYFRNGAHRAMLAEPLFQLLLGHARSVGYFSAQTAVYADLAKKYPILWGKYKYYPRCFKAMGILPLATHWRWLEPWPTAYGGLEPYKTPLARLDKDAQKPSPATLKLWLEGQGPR